MDKYFTPVCGSSEDERKLQKRQRQVQHPHPSQHRFRGAHGPSSSDEYRRHNDRHRQHYQNPPHHHHGDLMNVAPHHSQHKVLSGASTSSLSSSSSSTSSPWTSEPSLDNENCLLQNKPQHSLSCSNIPEARCIFQDEESDEEFDQSDSAVLRHHHQNQERRQRYAHSRQPHQGPEQGLRTSQLHRGQSKSEEGLLQSMSLDCSPRAGKRPHPTQPGPLYKTTSLGQNLAFNERAAGAAAKGMAGPKRAVSSIQLPSKGILKNKDEGQNQGNFRKAKSMEVLSTRVQATGPPCKPGPVEMVKTEFLKEKIKFSSFLDEITRQVISPSRLSSFGITSSTTPTTPASPKSAHEEHRQPNKTGKQGQEHVQPSIKQQSPKHNRSDGSKTATDSHSSSPSRRRTHPSKNSPNRHTVSPSSPTQQHQQHSKDRRPCATESPSHKHGSSSSHKHQQRKYSQLLTDGTSTSPEPVLQEKHHHSKHKAGSFADHEYQASPPPARPPGLDSESPSSKSSTATSLSSEKSHKNKHTGQRRHPKNTHKDLVSTEDRAELLEQYNKELHENLLQTVACIENMETELQCTKAELNGFKEKYKRLQESYTSCQQGNSVLEQKLQSVVDSMNSERKYHLHRIMELTKQVDAAKNTIISLENINVPSLIKELLDKHFDSQEAVRNFLFSSPNSPQQSDTDQSGRNLGLRDNQPFAGKAEEKVSDWLLPGQRGLNDRQQHVTAFLPWTESHDPWMASGKAGVQENDFSSLHKSGDSNLPFTVTDISQEIYRKLADEKAKGYDPVVTVHNSGPETEIHSVSTWRAGDVPVNPYSLEDIGSNRAGGAQRIDPSSATSNEVNYISAQKLLDNFMNQIPPSAQAGQLERDHTGRDWARRPAEGL